MNIFVFTAGIQAAQDHLKDTVENAIDPEIIQKYLTANDFESLKKKCNNEFYCWGAVPGISNVRNWDKIYEGDKILSYWGKSYHHLATIIFKTRNYDLAKELWGSDPEGKTWEYIYFFKKPQKFTKPLPAEDSAEYLQRSYMGFAKIRDDKTKRIQDEFGSLESFLLNKEIPQPKPERNNKKEPNINNYMNILTAIKTKPFILLAGISGTGKSRLVRTLAFKTCPKHLRDEEQKKPGNYELIPVRPNWHDSSELMGYVSRINGEKYLTTSFLQFIAKAWKHTDTPFFLCLDEMNLAPVEQYFAEYLSIIETRQVINGELITDYIISRSSFEDKRLYDSLLEDLELSKKDFSEGISLPHNLVVIGTVNMDETTYSFSRKVLDRAMTFEMNEVDLLAGLDVKLDDWSYPDEILDANEVLGEFTSGAEVYNETFKERDNVLKFLLKVNKELEGTPFKIAYRVRDEFLIYCYHSSQNPSSSSWLIDALDEMTSMKILSRIEGDENKTQHVLANLLKVITTDYKKSHAKLVEMEKRLQSSGYTSFWS